MLDLVRVAFKASLAQTSPGSLRHRHISFLLVCNNTSINCGKIERYQKRLMSRGVCKENVLLLRCDTMIPFSQQLGMIWPLSKEGKQERIKKRSTMAENTEEDVNECMVTLEWIFTPEMKDSMNAVRDILEKKLKDHHVNLGTLGCQETLAGRKKLCIYLKPLRKEDQQMVRYGARPYHLDEQVHGYDFAGRCWVPGVWLEPG